MDGAKLSTQEKRRRREIANENERRRMQHINDAFEELREQLPPGGADFKTSKVTVVHVNPSLSAKRVNVLLNE